MTRTPTRTRTIVHIDEDKCDGCGICVPSCAEGAIQIIEGKARLLAENLCDGLGNCLGTCPKDAITIEERPAEAFDEDAVREHLGHSPENDVPTPAGDEAPAPPPAGPQTPAGCPGRMARKLAGAAPPASRPGRESPESPIEGPSAANATSRLGHWPVQLALLPTRGEMWQDADVLLAADCVGFAVPDFHERFLAGKTLAVACPKLDDVQPYVQKLAQILGENDIRSVTVARMEVPCCSGLVRAVRAAMELAGRTDIPFTQTVVRLDGSVEPAE